MIQSALNYSQLTAFMDSIEILQPSTKNLDKFTKLSKKMFFLECFTTDFYNFLTQLSKLFWGWLTGDCHQAFLSKSNLFRYFLEIS